MLGLSVQIHTLSRGFCLMLYENTGLNPHEQYNLVQNYTMKCRIYPNPTQKAAIDAAIHDVSRTYNIVMYNMFHNFDNTKTALSEDGSVIHFPDLSSAAKASYLNTITQKKAPAAALSGQNGVILRDMKKSLQSQTKGDSKALRPIEHLSPSYYSKKHPRTSYTYQETFSKIQSSDNQKVFYISLRKVGRVKVRGWNTRLRFGNEKNMNFVEYAMGCGSKKAFLITVSKDNCNDYFISIMLQNVYIPVKSPIEAEIGIDVGVHDLVVLSNGTKFENKYFKKKKQDKLKALNKRMSRRQGPENIAFRKELKKRTNERESFAPSKSYEQTKLAYTKLERKIARQRNNYNHQVSKQIVNEHSFIGVESLDVAGMFISSNKNLAKALSDASIGSLLNMLSYKAEWYRRTIKPIDRWYPSSQLCHVCGFQNSSVKNLEVREWVCPICGTRHDRDVNAAINILNEAKSKS